MTAKKPQKQEHFQKKPRSNACNRRLRCRNITGAEMPSTTSAKMPPVMHSKKWPQKSRRSGDASENASKQCLQEETDPQESHGSRNASNKACKNAPSNAFQKMSAKKPREEDCLEAKPARGHRVAGKPRGRESIQRRPQKYPQQCVPSNDGKEAVWAGTVPKIPRSNGGKRRPRAAGKSREQKCLRQR